MHNIWNILRQKICNEANTISQYCILPANILIHSFNSFLILWMKPPKKEYVNYKVLQEQIKDKKQKQSEALQSVRPARVIIFHNNQILHIVTYLLYRTRRKRRRVIKGEWDHLVTAGWCRWRQKYYKQIIMENVWCNRKYWSFYNHTFLHSLWFCSKYRNIYWVTLTQKYQNLLLMNILNMVKCTKMWPKSCFYIWLPHKKCAKWMSFF